MSRQGWALGGVFGASALLASCCLAPTLFLLFGVSVSALGQLARLEPYRPVFMAVGGVSLLYVAWSAWGSSRVRPGVGACSAESGTCSGPGMRRRGRALACVALLSFALSLAYPSILQIVL